MLLGHTRRQVGLGYILTAVVPVSVYVPHFLLLSTVLYLLPAVRARTDWCGLLTAASSG